MSDLVIIPVEEYCDDRCMPKKKIMYRQEEKRNSIWYLDPEQRKLLRIYLEDKLEKETGLPAIITDKILKRDYRDLDLSQQEFAFLGKITGGHKNF